MKRGTMLFTHGSSESSGRGEAHQRIVKGRDFRIAAKWGGMTGRVRALSRYFLNSYSVRS